MIRAANSTDAFALVDILKERLPDSRYFGIAGIDESVARRFFAQCVQRHGGTTEGATLLNAWEVDGEIQAFMLGVLGRVYTVFDKLAASDVFLIGKRDCDPRAMAKLIDAYLAWADNPRVVEVGLSWADTIPGGELITAAYERRGFALCAKTYRRAVENPALGVAA